jgi:hypothetical protein
MTEPPPSFKPQSIPGAAGRHWWWPLPRHRTFAAHPELEGDDVHPTVTGQVVLAAAIQTAITAG